MSLFLQLSFVEQRLDLGGWGMQDPTLGHHMKEIGRIFDHFQNKEVYGFLLVFNFLFCN